MSFPIKSLNTGAKRDFEMIYFGLFIVWMKIHKQNKI